ncbi:MAG: hypothetical protein JSW33_09395 [bacterium]|nr:MAG: hypothetical protein JSW33_09395 [bacterium]
MKIITFFILFLSLAIIFYCGQITSDLENSDFMFSVKVKSPDNRPLEGLTISAWNLIRFPGEKAGLIPHGLKAATTTIMFDLFDDAQVDLTIKDLKNEIIQNIYEQTLLFPGKYSVAPSFQSRDGLVIYKCLLEVRDVKQHYLFFKDSTYMVLYQPDPTIAFLGLTNYKGEYQTDDRYKFPSTLANLPELVYTDISSPEPLGEITISDQIVIIVWDPQRFVGQDYQRKIQPGKNHFELTWDPQTSRSLSATSILPEMVRKKQIFFHENQQITQWKLYQNFPNPFN